MRRCIRVALLISLVGLATCSLGAGALAAGADAPAAQAAGSIERIELKGFLIPDCPLPGETKRDDVFPAHGNGIQAARNRWLMIYATRGYNFIDDDRSIVYQLREGAPDGRVIKEGFLSKFGPEWKPFGDSVAQPPPAVGSRSSPTAQAGAPVPQSYYKQHGHPVLFGVPKGALIKGKPAANANLFVAKWRVLGVNPAAAGAAKPWTNDPATQGVEWMQLRLNDAEDDIEVVQPPMPLRQKGCETGEAFCKPNEGAAPKTMNETFVQATPFNDDCTEWADANHFDGHGKVAAMKYRYNPEKKLYEWVEMGPLAGATIGEASLLHHGADWFIAARKFSKPAGIAWYRSSDPFRSLPDPVNPADPAVSVPISAFECPDGVIRLFTDVQGRSSLRCWEIDPRDFSASNSQAIFDAKQAKLPMRVAVVDMCKLLPHAGGKTQVVVFRIRSRSINYPASGQPVVTAEEKAAAGIYYALIHYTRDYPGCWQFVAP